MSSLDGTIRIIIALVAIALYYYGIVTGVIGIIAIVVAVIFVITGFAKFCPIYKIFGISTCKTKKSINPLAI